MLKEDFIQKNPAWVAELELMLKLKVKAEIQALSSFGFQFVTQVYLPRKLQAGDWIWPYNHVDSANEKENGRVF